MVARILRTSNNATPALIRLTLALVFFPHGAQHVLGWFGGYGFEGTLGWMTGLWAFHSLWRSSHSQLRSQLRLLFSSVSAVESQHWGSSASWQAP